MSYTKQVNLDLIRTHLSAEEQKNIAERILLVLVKHPHLHYYQGFHDVALTTTDFNQLEYIALECLRDFMTPTMSQTLKVLELVPQLLIQLDPSFTIVEKVKPHYALAPIITLFGHDTTDCKDIIEEVANKGLVYILYFYAAVILSSKSYIYKQLQGETDPEMVQAILTRASAQINSLDRKELHTQACEYARDIPIDSLAAAADLSRWSAVHGLAPLKEAEYASKKLSEPASYAGIVTMGILVTAVLVQWAMAR